MIKSWLSKLGQAFAVALGVVSICFFLFYALPGDPARMMMDQRENSEQLARIKAKYGFDLPLGQQFVFYLNDLSPLSYHPNHGFASYDSNKYGGLIWLEGSEGKWVLKWPYLRESFQQGNRKVSDILISVFPNTLLLAVAAMAIALSLGIVLGMLAALKAHTAIDRALIVFSSLGMSLPSFFSAILVSWLFGYVLRAYTGLEMNGNLRELDDLGEAVHYRWKNLILPAFTLGIRPLGVIVQLTRSSLLEVMQLDYIRTAKSKGLSAWQVMRFHALPNALIPVSTAASGWFAGMLAGSVFVEYIFGWNGLGKQVVEALQLLDLPVVMGSVLLIGLTFVLINMAMDVVYTYIDPRLRV